MSANIPERFKVDFSGYSKDMTAKAMDRLLSQFKGSPVLRAFVAALVQNGPQYVYDEIIKFQEANSLYVAEGGNLDAIGKIVGQPRVPYQYDESSWFAFDRQGQGFDQAKVWVLNASMTTNVPASDPEYRMMILARIACNFNRFSSLPEMQYIAEFVTGEKVTWIRTGPMEVQLVVRPGISRSRLDVLTKFTTTTACDDIPMIPYPATLSISSVLHKPTPRAFTFDRGDGHQFDAAPFAVSVPIN